MDRKGRFIVIEGIDGAGTTTQTALLCESLRARGLEARQTREPSDGPIGLLIRSFLEKRITPLRDAYSDESAERDTFSLLFTADRMDHQQRELIPALRQGAHVVCDRYYHSTFAYQMRDEDNFEWILGLHKYALEPDITFFIDLPVDAALGRITNRKQSESEGSAEDEQHELFETREQLQRIRSAYMTIIEKLIQRGRRIVVLDGSPSASEVHTVIMKEVETLIG